MSIPGLKKLGLAALLFGLLLAPVFLGAAHAQSNTSYVQEFSEPGEQGVLDSTWSYLTHDGVQRTIDVYRYGNVLIAFDQTGLTPLSDSQAVDFFQSYELRQLVATGQVSPASYSISFQQSVVCSVAVPEIGGQTSSLVVGQASDAIQKVLPDEASAIVGDLFSVGEKVGLITDVNPYVLALGAVCYGGNLIENYAASQLASCANYVQDLQNFQTYEGMPQDLVGCHDAAIQKLQLAQYSPNVLVQYGQTVLVNAGIEVSNIFGTLYCYVAQCQSAPQQFDQSAMDQVIAQITALKNADPALQGTLGLAQNDAQVASNRIQQKAGEANRAVGQLSSELSSVDSALAGHEGLYALADSLMTPSFDTADASSIRSQAASYLALASTYSQEYRYNSAVSAADQGQAYAASAAASIQQQSNIPRSVNPWVYSILLLPILIIAGIAIRRHQDDE